jgi:hypothetical protein
MRPATPLRRPPAPGSGRVGALIPVSGDPEQLVARFSADPATWLPSPAEALAESWWSVGLAAGPLHGRVRCHVGQPWTDAVGTWRLLTWRAEAGPFPGLEGSIGLRTARDLVTLVLDGGYRAPVHAASPVDHPALRRLAQSTAHRFVTDIASRLRVTATQPFEAVHG